MIRQGARVVLAGFYLLPWVWLIALGVFVGLVALAAGHFPAYSNPDPKHAGYSVLYVTTMMLLAGLLASPIFVTAEIALRALFRWKRLLSPAFLWAYLAGMALTAAIIFGNAFGLINWLLD